MAERLGDFEVREALSVGRVVYEKVERPSNNLEEIFSQDLENIEEKDHLVVVFSKDEGSKLIQAKRVVRLADDQRLAMMFGEEGLAEVRSWGKPVDWRGLTLRSKTKEDDWTKEETHHVRLSAHLEEGAPGETADPKIVETAFKKIGRWGIYSSSSYIIRAANASYLVEPKEESN